MTGRQVLCRALTVWLALIFSAQCPAGAISDQDSDNLRVLLAFSGAAVAGLKRDKDGLLQYGKSLATTGAVTLVLKAIVDSDRPNGEDNDSFPSGHVSTSIAAAAFLQKRYGPHLGIPAYIATAAIVSNRISNDHHRAADVIAGSAIAFVANHLFVDPALTVEPRFDQAGLIIQYQLNF